MYFVLVDYVVLFLVTKVPAFRIFTYCCCGQEGFLGPDDGRMVWSLVIANAVVFMPLYRYRNRCTPHWFETIQQCALTSLTAGVSLSYDLSFVCD